MSTIALLGASGHGKVVADMVELLKYDNILFYDDAWPEKNNLGPWQVVGNTEGLLLNKGSIDSCIVTIGDNTTRVKKQKMLESHGVEFPCLIHPSAVVSRYSKIGSGTVVMARAVINANSVIGDSCIVNTGSIVEHDSLLKDGVHISPGANLSGGICLKSQVWIGVGATLKQNVTIGAGSIVGAGAVVVNDIPAKKLAIGCPAQYHD